MLPFFGCGGLQFLDDYLKRIRLKHHLNLTVGLERQFPSIPRLADNGLSVLHAASVVGKIGSPLPDHFIIVL